MKSRTRTISARFLRIAACLGAACGVLPALGGCTPHVSDKDIAGISLAEVKELSGAPAAEKRALLIDPRPADEFAAGHLPGARSMDTTKVSGRPGETDPKLEPYGLLIVYGNDPGSGNAGAMTKKLMTTGYNNVRLFVGGLSEWKRAGLPVER